MNRITVYSYPTAEYDQDGPTKAGWFDADRAQRFGEDTDWNGNNHISVNTRTQWNHEELYRTAQGRWVLGKYSNYQGTMPSYEFIDGEQVKTWLTVNQHDDAVKRYFGEIEDERGPGRPALEGDPISIKLGNIQDAVDAYAERKGIKSRAEAIRTLCGKALDAEARAARQDPSHPLAHGNHCAGDPIITTDGGQYNAECNACGYEVTGCENRAEIGAAFYATVRTELLG